MNLSVVRLAFDSKKAAEGKDTDPAPLGAYGQLRDRVPSLLCLSKDNAVVL